jgi:MATE family multidrug resistance protein
MIPKTIFVQHQGLTSHPPGSLRELWQISFPLMLSLMSVSLMLFLDRLLLAHYSIDALNAAAGSSAVAQALQFWCMSMVCIAEVYVGRYNGAGRKDRVGKPVWQMIWLGIATLLFFLPLGIFAGPYIFSAHSYKDLEIQYFRWLMIFAPVAVISAALSSFYIGRGKVGFVTFVIVIANFINVGLDFVLIFGVEGWVPALGISGAAIATGVAQGFQSIVLFADFFRSKNRIEFGTGKWHLNRRMLTRCLRLGFPNAIAHTLEVLAWALLFHMMALLGTDYITVVAVAQSILFLFTFLTEGVAKGATAIASNFIGSNQPDLIWKVLQSGVKFYLLVFLFLSWILAINPDPLINWFLPPHIMELSPSLKATLHSACFWVWLFFLFDGIGWLLMGLLTAAGDTRFIMKVGGTSPWLIALLPIYLLVFQFGASTLLVWPLIAFYGLTSCCIYFYRFKQQKWKDLVLESV